jgi:hypothetical protein
MVGLGPKRFCRLACFKAGLVYAGTGTGSSVGGGRRAAGLRRPIAHDCRVSRTGGHDTRHACDATLVPLRHLFALSSWVHSYLVLTYSEADRVSLNVGFYMANACGRLLGTLLSGVLYQQAGVAASMWGAVALTAAAGIGAVFLPPVAAPSVSWAGASGDD